MDSTGASVGAGSTVADIASFVGGEIDGKASLVINGLNSLDHASADDLTFLHGARWAKQWPESSAGASLVTRGMEVPGHDPSNRALVIVDDAEIAMLRVLESFAASCKTVQEPGVHDSAVIHDSARVGKDVHIGPHVSIAENAMIGDGVCLGPGCRIGHDVVIGDKTILHSNVVIEHGSHIGRGCRLHAGVVIGADGFGYRPDPDGAGLRKVPHLGIVQIGDDVEIGAGTCVDRGKFGATRIGDNTKLDNLVQVAHNVAIGRSTVIAAQVGIAGSAKIGSGVQIGAHAGIVEHVTIGDGARIGAKAGVIRNVPAGEAVAGIPAQPAKETLRQVAAIRKLPEYLAQQGRPRG